MKKIPRAAKVIIIGGGVVGCSCAYHLAKFGWKDVILLERDKLTSGTTWHAAGLVSQIGPTAPITKIRKYSLDLYKDLEKKIDHSAGLRLNGALSIAQEEGRWQELKRQATTAQLYDFDVQILNKHQVREKVPLIKNDDLLVPNLEKHIVDIKVEANFEQLIDFLRQIELLENIILINDLKIIRSQEVFKEIKSPIIIKMEISAHGKSIES